MARKTDVFNGKGQKLWKKAKMLIARKEPGRRAKFVKKENATYLFDDALRQKSELLLGIKGYCTNIPERVFSNEQIVSHYDNLWRIKQAFRMSKTDLKTSPIFHYTHDLCEPPFLLNLSKYFIP